MHPKPSKLRAVLCAGAMAALSAVGAQASSLSFKFTTSQTSVPPTTIFYEGIVTGLSDNGISEATSVVITKSPLGATGNLVPASTTNFFRVTNGQVVQYLFKSSFIGSVQKPSGPVLETVSFELTTSSRPSLALRSSSVFFGNNTPVVFTPITAAVPLPAGGLLVLTGLLGLAGLRRSSAWARSRSQA